MANYSLKLSAENCGKTGMVTIDSL